MSGSSGGETLLVDQWLVDTLVNDVTLQGLVGGTVRIFENLAPANTAYPFITYLARVNQDKSGVGTDTRIFNRAQYVIKAVAQVDSFITGVLGPIARRIDALIEGDGELVVGGSVLGVVRDEEYRQTEVDEGLQIRHLGGVYSIWAYSD